MPVIRQDLKKMHANFLFELLLTALINPENVIYIGSLAKNKKKTKIFNK